MSDLNERENQIKEKFDSVSCKPFEEVLAEIKPKLRKKNQARRKMSKPLVRGLIAATAALIILIGALSLYFFLPQGEIPPQRRYEDADIDLSFCPESDIIDYAGLYVPDLSILINTEFQKGIHKEYLDIVYFKIQGTHIDFETGTARTVKLNIIIQKSYDVFREEIYNSTDQIEVEGYIISYLKDAEYYGFFVNSYKIGFKKGDVRYYIDYETTSEENDIEAFMRLFLQ